MDAVFEVQYRPLRLSGQEFPLYGTLQRMIPTRLRPQVLFMAYHPRLTGHSGATRMYYTLGREYYCLHMASDSFSTVRNSASSAAICGTIAKNQNDLKLFHAASPLEFVAMDLLGPRQDRARKPTRSRYYRLVLYAESQHPAPDHNRVGRRKCVPIHLGLRPRSAALRASR